MATEQHAGDPLVSRAARPAGDSSGPGRLRAAVHARLEEMRFRHGMLLMVTAAAVLVVAITGITLALTGDPAGKGPGAGEPPIAAPSESSSTPDASGPTPEPRGSARRPEISSSTRLGSSIPPPVVSPSASPSTSTSGPPTWWPTGHPHRHHGSPPPWWHHQ
ncbi:hypothetical protein [Actinoallomurus acaciae]|uniref:Uncharacterized protein n=1 Tax=Actinoallomurus acaciae TaxID=502577 RepID=A0ABV5YF87_9ACTN